MFSTGILCKYPDSTLYFFGFWCIYLLCYFSLLYLYYMPLMFSKIIKDDCVAALRKIKEESVDLIFADPPYNLQLGGELFRPNNTKVDGVDDAWDKFTDLKEYDKFTVNWLQESKRVLKPNGTLWVIGSYHNIYRVGSILQDLDFWILNDVVWIKSNPMPNFKGTRFNNAHETLLWVSKDKNAKFTFNYKTMKTSNDDKQMRSDWVIPICSGKERIKTRDGEKAHSTQKPEELLKRVIISSSKQGDVVLDPFLGSGTTGAVAKMLNRSFIGIEREEKYITVAKERIKKVKRYNEEYTVNFQEVPKPRVPFGNLVESNYIKVGVKLYSKDKKHWAKVMADGTLKNGKYFGSIHKVSAEMLERESNNGWIFWNVQKNGKLVSIDSLRELYFQETTLAG